MNTSKRSIRTTLVVGVGGLFLMLALVPMAWAGEAATPQETTIAAGQTAVRETQSAARTSIPLTGTAFKSTLVAAQAGIKSTATAFKLTATVQAQNVKTTGTAVKATLGAAVTAINSEVVAIRTSPATSVPPDGDANSTIDYFSTNILGFTPTLMSARNATSGDAFKLSLTDFSAPIQRYAFNYGATNYYGLLANGNVVVSLGLGKLKNENIPDSLAEASAVTYTVQLTAVGTVTESSALTLATTTFPNIADFTYIRWRTSRGLIWIAPNVTGLLDTKTVKDTRSWIMVYVVPKTGGNAQVTVMVVTGDFVALTPR